MIHKISFDAHINIAKAAGLSGQRLDNFKEAFIKRYNNPKHKNFWKEPNRYAARTLDAFVEFKRCQDINETFTKSYQQLKNDLYGFKNYYGTFVSGLLGKKLMKMLGY